jgi:hypothetical protein
MPQLRARSEARFVMYNESGVQKESVDRERCHISDVIVPQTDGPGVGDYGGVQTASHGYWRRSCPRRFH